MTNKMDYSTDQVLNLLQRDSVKLIDIRSVDAYNGWRLREELRGGHIKSAKSLPFKWLKYFDWLDIVKYKKILPSDNIILYGYEPQEMEMVASHFNRAGYQNVGIYYDFINRWSANPNLPMENLQKYKHLVSPQWLNSLIKKGYAAEFNNSRYVICHAHYRNKSAYDEGHIPGSVDIDTNTLESIDTWNRRPPHELKATLEQTGITFDTTVILYGRNSVSNFDDPFPGSSAGQLAAMRCALIMLYAGVKDVRVLNGGLQSWMDEGFEISKENTPSLPVYDFGAKIPASPELFIDTDEAKEYLKSKDKNLICVRSRAEYFGEVSGYNYIHKKGRIPGAVFADCGSDAYHMENYRNSDQTTREYHEIEQLWYASGITSDKKNAFYCGTGWRASEAFFNAWLMGWNGVSVYDGGWFEWSNDEKNPYETGVPRGFCK
jgi:3-mercaptopyruvate sulfurtransferase SseA